MSARRWWRAAVAAAAMAAAAATTASHAQAAFVSSLAGSTAVVTGDALGDTFQISAEAGFLRHNRYFAGDPNFASATDWNTAVPGVQELAATSASVVAVAAGAGADTVISAVAGPELRIDGGAGSDVFEILPGASVGAGYLDGGDDLDRLDYHQRPVGVQAGLASVATATLRGTDQVPANASSATGSARVEVDQRSGALRADLTATGTATSVTAAHLHSPAPPGANSPVLSTILGCSGVVAAAGCALDTTLTPAQRSDFADGLVYVDVHTVSSPAGEIRGQLKPVTPVAPGVPILGRIEDLEGGAGADVLRGSQLANVLTGDGGVDTFAAGGGNDLVLASGDGAADNVGCGPGDDFVTADPNDAVAADCERITRVTPGPPAPGSMTPVPGAPAGASGPAPVEPPVGPPGQVAAEPRLERAKPRASFTVAARQRRRTLLAGAFALRATSSEAALLVARVEVSARTARALGLTRSRAASAFVLARASARLTAAGRTTIRFALPKSARAKLRRVRRLAVAVRLSATDPAGNVGVAAARRVTFTAR